MPDIHDYLLRPMRIEDQDRVLAWRNKDGIRAYMYTDHVIGREEHARWTERVLADDSQDYLIGEFCGEPFGLVGASRIDRVNGKCEWAFYVGGDDAPRSSGSALEYLALEYIFDELQMRKLCCEVFAFNERVIKMHKKFGFVEEGVLKQHMLKNGEYQDVVLLALFRDVWHSQRERMRKIVFR